MIEEQPDDPKRHYCEKCSMSFLILWHDNGRGETLRCPDCLLRFKHCRVQEHQLVRTSVQMHDLQYHRKQKERHK